MSIEMFGLKRLVRVEIAGALAVLALLFGYGSEVAVASPSFGIEAFDQQVTVGQAGGTFTQAGGHPYAITTELSLNSEPDPTPGELFGLRRPVGDVKDIATELSPGLFGNPAGLPQCSEEELVNNALAGESHPYPLNHPMCPVGSQVGVIEVRTEAFRCGAPG